jgi:hypothetical protein
VELYKSNKFEQKSEIEKESLDNSTEIVKLNKEKKPQT